MTVVSGSASGENSANWIANQYIIALELNVTATGKDYQLRSSTPPERIMHGGWFAFVLVTGHVLTRAVTWHKYVEYHHEAILFPANQIVGSALIWAIPLGTSVDWWVTY